MVTYEIVGEVNAPIERVWAVLSKVEAWPAWLPTVSSVEPLGSAPIMIGARYRVRQPKLRSTVWTVSELEPPVRFAWRASSPGVELLADHALERTSAEVIRVRLRFEFRGWLGRLLGKAYGAITQAYLSQEVEALKRVVEK